MLFREMLFLTILNPDLSEFLRHVMLTLGVFRGKSIIMIWYIGSSVTKPYPYRANLSGGKVDTLS